MVSATSLPVLQVSDLPVQVLRGIYLGLLTGIVPAVVAWILGFLFKYISGVSIPGFGVVVLGLGIAGLNGGLLALNDPTVLAAGPTLVVAVMVVLMLTLYAHSKGDALGARLPRRLNLRKLANRTLSADVVEIVDARRQARVRVTGEVDDLEGYPALPAELREEIRTATYTFPADLPLSDLERRTAERLRGEFDLADVRVTLDDRGRATVAAAPPVGTVSRRVEDGERAVSVETLLPTGVVRGDTVRLPVADGSEDGGDAVRGRVVAARSDGAGSPPAAAADEAVPPPRAPSTVGGEGRLTLAVPASETRALLSSRPRRAVVESRGSSRASELVGLLSRAGSRFGHVTVREDGPLDGRTIAEAGVRAQYDVALMAVRSSGSWRVAPGGDVRLAGGDELYAVGRREALSAFAEAVGA